MTHRPYPSPDRARHQLVRTLVALPLFGAITAQTAVRLMPRTRDLFPTAAPKES